MPPELPASSAPRPRLRSLPREESPRSTSVAPPPSALPHPLTALIGREADVTAACGFLRDGPARLLTLTGPGGVGKTRLALRIAEQAATTFTDGVVFVPLAAVTDPALVLPMIVRVLGLREDATQSQADQLANYLGDRRRLLLLDNFEQVAPAAAEIAALLAVCPRAAVVVTSRAVLNVAGEQQFPVLPLALPPAEPAGEPTLRSIAASPAVQLFVARAQAHDPGFDLDAGNAASIAAICQRLDGLPLAIELAAARARHLVPNELLARLNHVLPLLTGGPANAPPRQRTMRHAIAWSYDLLAPAEQALFRRLAYCLGGFPLELAEWMAGETGTSPDGTTTLDRVAALIDQSMAHRSAAGGATRFDLLQTVRAFGLEQLAACGETTAVAARHGAWCVRLVDEVRQSGRLSHRAGLARLEAEHPNLRLALEGFLERGETTTALHLAGQLAEFWLRHAHFAEGTAWLERALATDVGRPTAARANALVGLSMLQWNRNDLTRADDLLAEAEQVARAAGDPGALAYARLHQGYAALYHRDFERATARAKESLERCAAIPQGFSCHGARWLLGRARLGQGDDEPAAVLFEQLLRASRAAGDEISVGTSLIGLAMIAERRGAWEPALTGFAEAASVCQAVGDPFHASDCLSAAAVIAAEHGRPEPAARLFAAVASLRTAAGAVAGPIFQFDLERLTRAHAAVQAALGTERFATAWAAGGALTLEAAIAEASALANAADSLASPRLDATASGLTAREREVLRLLVAGRSDKEIAAELGIGRRTVSGHVAAIRAKLGAPSRTAAATVAVRERLI